MDELRKVKCDILTIGQYLQPTKDHEPVHQFYTPEEFAELEKQIQPFGFLGTMVLPLARSSYRAEAMYCNAL